MRIRKYSTDALLVSAVRISGSAFSIIATAQLARALDSATFVMIALIISANQVISIVANMGFSQLALKLLNPKNSTDYGDRNTILFYGIIITVTFGLALSIFAVVPIWGWHISALYMPCALVAVAFLFTSAIQFYLSELLRARNSILSASLLGAVGTYGGPMQLLFLVTYLTGILIAKQSANLEEILLVLLSSSVLTIPALLLFNWNFLRVSLSAVCSPRVHIKRLFSLALSSATTSIISAVRGQMSLWIGALVVSPSALAMFIGAGRIAALFGIPVNILSYSMSYHLVMGREGRSDASEMPVRNIVTFISLLCLPAIIITFFFEPTISNLFLGAAFQQPNGTLVLLAFINFLQLFMGGTNQVLSLNGAHVENLFYVIVTTIVGAILTYALGVVAGATGMAIAATVTISLYYLVTVRHIHRHRLPVTWGYTSWSDYIKFAQNVLGIQCG